MVKFFRVLSWPRIQRMNLPLFGSSWDTDRAKPPNTDESKVVVGEFYLS